jgi:metal-responsive CopG/Arc/MetJ family transcriptional regulator
MAKKKEPLIPPLPCRTPPVRRVNVDLTQGMLRNLDERAARLNISRQAVIKTLLGRALNEEREPKARPKNG